MMMSFKHEYAMRSLTSSVYQIGLIMTHTQVSVTVIAAVTSSVIIIMMAEY